MPTVLICVKGQSRGGWKEKGGEERTDYLKEEKICFSGISQVSVSEQLCFLFFSLLLASTINYESIMELSFAEVWLAHLID